jgi:hypothetical protein
MGAGPLEQTDAVVDPRCHQREDTVLARVLHVAGDACPQLGRAPASLRDHVVEQRTALRRRQPHGSVDLIKP